MPRRSSVSAIGILTTGILLWLPGLAWGECDRPNGGDVSVLDGKAPSSPDLPLSYLSSVSRDSTNHTFDYTYCITNDDYTRLVRARWWRDEEGKDLLYDKNVAPRSSEPDPRRSRLADTSLDKRLEHSVDNGEHFEGAKVETIVKDAKDGSSQNKEAAREHLTANDLFKSAFDDPLYASGRFLLPVDRTIRDSLKSGPLTYRRDDFIELILTSDSRLSEKDHPLASSSVDFQFANSSDLDHYRAGLKYHLRVGPDVKQEVNQVSSDFGVLLKAEDVTDKLGGLWLSFATPANTSELTEEQTALDIVDEDGQVASRFFMNYYQPLNK
jgi:hypothetical protein